MRMDVAGIIAGGALAVLLGVPAAVYGQAECVGQCSVTTSLECIVDEDCPPTEECINVGDCCLNDGAGSYVSINPAFTIDVAGGQVNMAGATLFVDFFRLPASTNDWIDVDGDGISGGPFPVDQLAASVPGDGSLDSHWIFNYRSVGSVNGFNEFVDSETCGALSYEIPSEAGLFNRYLYAELGEVLTVGATANRTGTPIEQCAIQGSFLDVPAQWAVQVDGTPAWDRAPTAEGYGLNPIPSDSGFISNLQTLSRTCGTCTSSGAPCVDDASCEGSFTTECSLSSSACDDDADCLGTCSIAGTPCALDADCPMSQTCTGFQGTCEPLETCDTSGGAIVSLNTNEDDPDADTIFSRVAAWVPVLFIANRGVNLDRMSYSQGQHHWVTGRMPNGENLVAATRDVGSGTRNAFINSLGIDTSWGRGDNIGDHNPDGSRSNLGPDHQPTNCGGSGIIETVVQNRRLAVGYTGMAGGSRAVADAKSGRYEILDIWKDVDPDCAGTPTYVHPSINSVLDNCGCDGYQISGSGSFVVRGNPDTNRHGRCTTSRDICVTDDECPMGETCDDLDPRYVDPAPGEKVPNQQVAEYLNNIFDSVASFEGGVEPGECVSSRICSDADPEVPCDTDNDCLGQCSVSGDPCSSDADCGTSGGTCVDYFGTCLPQPCEFDEDCSGVGDECRLKFNMPGQLLVQQFFLPAGIDCIHELDAPLVYLGRCSVSGASCDVDADCPSGQTCAKPVNPDVQQYIRDNNDLGAGSVPDGSDYLYGISSVSGFVPKRNSVVVTRGISAYSDGSTTGSYCRPDSTADWDVTSSEELTARHKVQGDMNGDTARTAADAAGLVDAYYSPRAWSNANDAIAEVLGDFDGDGSLTKEDLRYWADGLHLVAGKLDRKAGAVAIDTAIQGEGRPMPWADTRVQIITPATSCTTEPGYPAPAGMSGFLATGKTYAAGDFRGDVAGTSRVGAAPVAGASPKGWDGLVNAEDIDYVCDNQIVGADWTDIDQAVYSDLSCDMDGDLAVDGDDVTELVRAILKTRMGDVNLDGVFNCDDMVVIEDSILNGCGGDDCGWTDGDMDCDQTVTVADLQVAGPGDADHNGTLDTSDQGLFNECMAGPGAAPTPTSISAQECLDAFDLDLDDDVDLDDWSVFQCVFGSY